MAVFATRRVIETIRFTPFLNLYKTVQNMKGTKLDGK